MTRLIKYIIFSLLLTNMAAAQIDIPITPPVNPPKTPVDPPGPREPISVRPDPSRPGGGDFDGKFYEYCGPSWLGYKCNFLRSDGVAKMRDVSNAYKAKQVSSYQKEMDAATAKVDKDLASLREGLVTPDSEEGKQIRAKLDAAKGLKANAATIDNATLQFQETATTDIDSTVDVSFGLAYKESDKKDYEPEARKVNLVVGERFIKSKIKREQDRAEAIESQIKNGSYANKDDRLAMVRSGRVALEISAQSLQQGDVAKSNFALKVGTVFLDTAISVTPVLGWAKDGWEAVTGRNLLTGEKLSGFERTMAVVGVLTAGIGSKLAIAGKAAILVGVLRAGKTAEEATELAKVASKAEHIIESAAKALPVDIPWGSGKALQDMGKEALAVRDQVENGASVYRLGTRGSSNTGVKAQFWSPEHPLTPGYGNKYGIPQENIDKADFIETAIIKDGGNFITRPAPGVGSNAGGAIEVVVPEGGVIVTSHVSL